MSDNDVLSVPKKVLKEMAEKLDKALKTLRGEST